MVNANHSFSLDSLPPSTSAQVLIEDASGDMVNVNRARALIEEAIDTAAPEALSPSAMAGAGAAINTTAADPNQGQGQGPGGFSLESLLAGGSGTLPPLPNAGGGPNGSAAGQPPQPLSLSLAGLDLQAPPGKIGSPKTSYGNLQGMGSLFSGDLGPQGPGGGAGGGGEGLFSAANRGLDLMSSSRHILVGERNAQGERCG